MTATPPENLPDLPDFCWPVDVSCIQTWDADPAVWTAAEKARAMSLAVQSLRMLTAYRVGGCPISVRPATRACRTRTWRTYPVGGDLDGPWQPVNLGGQWLNIGCGHTETCSCLASKQVILTGATIVTEVLVDGMTLDPAAYRLDVGGRLVRLDGEGWPLCQDLSKSDSEVGTWSVTYLQGVPVDGLGAYVAGLLTAEFLEACGGGQCSLPDTVSQVVRQGVTLTFAPGLFPGGLTGIRAVDAWTERWNPYRHKTPPGVWSPDLVRHQRTSEAIEWTPTPEDIDGGTP